VRVEGSAGTTSTSITSFWELLHRNTKDLRFGKRVNKFCTAAPAVLDRDAAFLDVSSLNLAVPMVPPLFLLGRHVNHEVMLASRWLDVAFPPYTLTLYLLARRRLIISFEYFS
jgi:hypothetical protein